MNNSSEFFGFVLIDVRALDNSVFYCNSLIALKLKRTRANFVLLETELVHYLVIKKKR